jgi:hypothetical protein
MAAMPESTMANARFSLPVSAVMPGKYFERFRKLMTTFT